MKTIKFLSTVVAVAIVAVATAVEKPKMNVLPLTADRAVISIFNNDSARFELSIHAQNGDLVYYKQSTKPINSYQKVFDFEDMENGSYSFNLRINDTQLSRDFEVASNEINFREQKLRFDPYFKFEDNKLLFSYLNFDEEKLGLSIYGSEGLVFHTKLGDDFNISSGYDLSKLESGTYDVTLSSLTNEYSYSLKK